MLYCASRLQRGQAEEPVAQEPSAVEQMNLPHAKQLYEEVIRLYPTSKEAATARTRLTALKHSQ